MESAAISERPITVSFLPFMTPGHIIPMTDIAKLFALRPNISVSIITTPGNEHLIRPSISSTPITLHLVPFPSSVSHLLHNGSENLASIPSSAFFNFSVACGSLKQPIQSLLLSSRPDCIISDYMFPWTTATADLLKVPRIVFYGHGIFTSCVHDLLLKQTPHLRVSDDSEVFIVEGLHHRVQMTRSEVSVGVRTDKEMVESVEKSYGVIVNSFVELELEYAELFRTMVNNAYYVGPVSLPSSSKETAIKSNPEFEKLMSWLDTMEKNSVILACFGSLNEFSSDQVREIALGLELSGRNFVWAVRNLGPSLGLPEDYEERVKGKGVVIRGWAPQVVILNHPAVGGFVTHCGWNSTLESVSAGVAMVTWPVEYEQFVNEKLITDVLGVGVRVERDGKGLVKAKEIAEAVKRAMGEEREAEERRERVRKYAEMARAAMEEGGSSYLELNRLIQEIRDRALINYQFGIGKQERI